MEEYTDIKIPHTQYRDRIYRAYESGEVVVVRHSRVWNPDPLIAELLGDEEGRVYESIGKTLARFPYGTHTLNEVALMYGAEA